MEYQFSLFQPNRITVRVADSESPNDPVRYRQIRQVRNADGSWTRMEYGANGFQTVQVQTFKNSVTNAANDSAQATYYTYTPVDTNDCPAARDARPRVEEERILGRTVAKTFHAYPTNQSGERMEIVERAASSDAVYGAVGNERTTRTYYGPAAAAANRGRLKSVQYPDGRLSAYYKRRGDFAQAKLHAHSALKKAQSRPEKFHAELVCDLAEEVAYLDQCLQAGRLID